METWRIFFTGVGGQGTILATRVLGEAALIADIPVVVSEIHGMAQRGGVVESAVVMGAAQSPVISDGQADILLGFEPLETLRALPKCSAGTLVISSINPVIPFTVASGRARYPEVEEIMSTVAARVDRLVAVDARSLARRAGSELAANMVLLGVLVHHGMMPFGREAVEKALRMRVKRSFLQVNLQAFNLGFQVN